jgi:predicted signal transduction protein with EAL and GGDEF domain
LRCIASDDDTVARLGGDEFAILKFVSSTSEAVSFAQAVISSLSETVVIDDVRVQTGASVGIALAPLHDTVPTRLMQCADLALYRAKSEGRGTFCFFEREMDERAQARRSLEFDLRQALPRNEFHLVFQPLVRAGDSCLIGLEALLRWERPGHGLVPPAEFIPIAEKSGLIIGIGEWALREACRTAAEWPQTISVAVNLSPIQFKKPGLVAMITNALASSGLPPSRLDLEITEAVLLQDDEKTENTLKQLRSLGIRISIDDFGFGYSSLSYLRRFDVDKIKIDQSFISHLDSRGKNFAILQSIGELGARLGLETVAEGIETETQLEMAQNAGCTELQGYLIGRPLSAMDVLSLISRSDLGASASQDVPSDKSISAIRSISNSTDRNNPQASADTIEAHEIARRRST